MSPLFLVMVVILAVPSVNGGQLTNTCNYTSGPKAGKTERFPTFPPQPVGTLCFDGADSRGVTIPDSGPGSTGRQIRTTTCRYESGPKIGQVESLRDAPPMPVDVPCNDGRGSAGRAVRDDDPYSVLVGREGRLLPIRPIIESAPGLSWAAVGEMVFRHYGIPAISSSGYQCGIVGFTNPDCRTSCQGCWPTYADPKSMFMMLSEYPRYAGHLSGREIKTLRSRFSGPLDRTSVVRELDERRPIIVGYAKRDNRSPGANYALIVGYAVIGDAFALIINDPGSNAVDVYRRFDREAAERRGQFRIDQNAFREQFSWESSIFGIE
jgi:hypothetical protein